MWRSRFLFVFILINHMVIKPFSRMETYSEYDCAKSPVAEHTNPYGNWTKSPDTAEINAKAYSTKPHSAAGGYHGEFYISGCTHSISWDKRNNPGNWLNNCDKGNHLKAELCTGRFHSGKHCNGLCEYENNQTAGNDYNLRHQ